MVGIAEVAMVLPALFVMSQMDWQKRENVLYVQVAYGVVQVFAIVLWLVLYKVVSRYPVSNE